MNEYLELIKNNPVKIGHAVGFTDLTDVHNEWLKLFLYSTDDLTLLAHRGSFKTTCLSVAIALIMVVLPEINIIFMRKTDTDVIEIVNQVSKILKHDVFRHIVKALYGVDLIITAENASSITTNLFTAARGTSQLLGLGTKSSMTGKHGALIITDDIVNIKDRGSRAERNYTKSIYMELQNIKNRGGRILNTGTPWHKDDCISIMPNVIRFDCYSTGLIPRNELNSIRSSMTNALFAANYELKHIASDDVIFTEPKFIPFTEAIYNGICHVDASYGGADATAFTIIKKQTDGKIIAFGKRWEKHVDQCMEDICKLRDKYKAGSIHCESNADKGYLAKEFKKLKIPVKEYHESMNKFIKISTHLKGVWSDMTWLDSTDADYINEILDYNEQADHDDSPDSAASLIRESEIVTKWGW